MSIERQTKNHIVHEIIGKNYCLHWYTVCRELTQTLFEEPYERAKKYYLRWQTDRLIQQKHFNIEHWNFLSYRWKCKKWTFDLCDLDLWPWLMKKQQLAIWCKTNLLCWFYVDMLKTLWVIGSQKCTHTHAYWQTVKTNILTKIQRISPVTNRLDTNTGKIWKISPVTNRTHQHTGENPKHFSSNKQTDRWATSIII